jgi:hypothetical protein
MSKFGSGVDGSYELFCELVERAESVEAIETISAEYHEFIANEQILLDAGHASKLTALNDIVDEIHRVNAGDLSEMTESEMMAEIASRAARGEELLYEIDNL